MVIGLKRYLTKADARSDVFDYIERFQNPRMRRRLEAQNQKYLASTQLSVEVG